MPTSFPASSSMWIRSGACRVSATFYSRSLPERFPSRLRSFPSSRQRKRTSLPVFLSVSPNSLRLKSSTQKRDAPSKRSMASSPHGRQRFVLSHGRPEDRRDCAFDAPIVQQAFRVGRNGGGSGHVSDCSPHERGKVRGQISEPRPHLERSEGVCGGELERKGEGLGEGRYPCSGNARSSLSQEGKRS